MRKTLNFEDCYFSYESGKENIIHQMKENNTTEYWKEEAKKNSDVALETKQKTKTKHLYIF